MQIKGRARNRVEQILQSCKGDKFNEWEQGRIQNTLPPVKGHADFTSLL
jgi:hypothetical protein